MPLIDHFENRASLIAARNLYVGVPAMAKFQRCFELQLLWPAR
jgi:hypothetical protein